MELNNEGEELGYTPSIPSLLFSTAPIVYLCEKN